MEKGQEQAKRMEFIIITLATIPIVVLTKCTISPFHREIVQRMGYACGDIQGWFPL